MSSICKKEIIMRKLEDVISIMEKKPYLLDMGAGKLSKIFKVPREMIYEARQIVRDKRIIGNSDKKIINKSISEKCV